MAKKKKLPRTIKVVDFQTGKRKSIRKDKFYKALTPGKRISKSRKQYYEYRKSKSDKKGSRL